MFCRKCGKEFPDDSQFCPGCGTSVISDANTPKKVNIEQKQSANTPAYIPASPTPQTQQIGSSLQQKATGSTAKTIRVVIGVLVSIFAFICTIGMFSDPLVDTAPKIFFCLFMFAIAWILFAWPLKMSAKNKKRLPLSAVIVVAILLIGIMIGALISANDSESVSTPQPTPSSTASSNKSAYGLNQPVVIDGMTVTAIKISKSYGSAYVSPSSGYVYVGVYFTAYNPKDYSDSISTLVQFDSYVGNTMVDEDLMAEFFFFNPNFSGTVAPGKTLSGWYAVEVPINSKTLVINIKEGTLWNGTKIEFAIPIPQ